MRSYPIWQFPYLAFFSKKLYQETGLRGKGSLGLYLLLLLGVCLVPAVVKAIQGMDVFVRQEAPKFISQVPEITITKGIASIAAPEPYEIRDPDTGESLILIDTRDAAPEEYLNHDNRVLLTRTQLIYHRNDYETRVFSLANIDALTLNPEVLRKWLKIIVTVIAWLSYPSALLYIYSFRLMQVLFFSLIGLLLCTWLKANPISFSGIFRVSVLALTPAILLKTAAGIFNLTVPGAGWIYFGLTLGYLVFGILAIAQEQKNLAAPVAPVVSAPVIEPVLSASSKSPRVQPAKARKKTTRKVVKVVKKTSKAVRKRATPKRGK